MTADDRPSAERIQVFAVVRFERSSREPNIAFTVKEVLPSLDEAKKEAERLNRLTHAKDDIQYFWQTTRFYPAGRGIDSKAP